MLNFFFMEKYRFQIGDRVRVIGNSNNHGFSTGDTVRIKNVSLTEAYDYIAEYLDRHDYWYVRARDLEPFFPPKTKTKEMATAKKAAQKTASKKSATKKAASKKTAAKKTAVRKTATKETYAPLDDYDGYELATYRNDSRQVTFGCGAVTLYRKDLLNVADLIENGGKSLSVLETIFQDESIDVEEFLDLSVKDLEAYIKLRKDRKLDAGIRSLREIKEAVGSRRSIDQILGINPTTLRRIAATPKDRTC